jgi:alpha,alpha-trehalase
MKKTQRRFRSQLILSILISLSSPLLCQERQTTVRVEVKTTLDSLMHDEDTDNDRKITIDDPHIAGTERGDRRFWLTSTGGARYEVSGTYYLSNLLQELKFAEEAGKDTADLGLSTVFEPPADRISRMIGTYFWDGLTRHVDGDGLAGMLKDEKTASREGKKYLYVPPTDTLAFAYFTTYAEKHPDLNMSISKLPDRITPAYVRSLDGIHGLLTLALRPSAGGGYEGVPFVVPGGRFNEMYGWDSYFITLGLLHDGRVGLAKSMVDNFVYEIDHYGKILNANRTYYLTRSQPPFLTSMIRAVYARLPRNDSTALWLHGALEAAIDEYTNVWTKGDHLTATGLSRYFDTGRGPSPEVEAGHFDPIYAPYAKRAGMDIRAFERAYSSGALKIPELDEFFVHDRAMRESGHDTSYRLLGVCADLVTVDLNSLLFRIELDIAELITGEFHDSFRTRTGGVTSGALWRSRAERRKTLMDRYLWNPRLGIYCDYDVREGRQRPYVSATTLYPLWAGAATNKQAASLISHALPLLEVAGGIVSSNESSRGPLSAERPERQWDYPNGWAPHQILVWRGLTNYGYESAARRLAYRWLYTIVSNAVDYNGTIPEKFDLVRRTHRVFAEYGNVGTTFSYITREGFGWTNASFEIGLDLLSQDLRYKLNNVIPPEWIFPE